MCDVLNVTPFTLTLPCEIHVDLPSMRVLLAFYIELMDFLLCHVYRCVPAGRQNRVKSVMFGPSQIYVLECCCDFSLKSTWIQCMDGVECGYAVNKTATQYTVTSHTEINEVYDFVCPGLGEGTLSEIIFVMTWTL